MTALSLTLKHVSRWCHTCVLRSSIVACYMAERKQCVFLEICNVVTVEYDPDGKSWYGHLMSDNKHSHWHHCSVKLPIPVAIALMISRPSLQLPVHESFVPPFCASLPLR